MKFHLVCVLAIIGFVLIHKSEQSYPTEDDLVNAVVLGRTIILQLLNVDYYAVLNEVLSLNEDQLIEIFQKNFIVQIAMDKLFTALEDAYPGNSSVETLKAIRKILQSGSGEDIKKLLSQIGQIANVKLAKAWKRE